MSSLTLGLSKMQRVALFAIGSEIKMVHFLEPMDPYQGVVAFKLEQLLRKVARLQKGEKTTTGSEKKVALVHCACPGSRTRA